MPPDISSQISTKDLRVDSNCIHMKSRQLFRSRILVAQTQLSGIRPLLVSGRDKERGWDEVFDRFKKPLGICGWEET
jgi:hypothetical protein